MRYSLSSPAKEVQLFSEPFWASARLRYINGALKYPRAAAAALILAMLFLTSAAKAQFQLQRLYTAPNGSPPMCLVQGNDGNFYGTLVNPSAPFSTYMGYVFSL